MCWVFFFFFFFFFFFLFLRGFLFFVFGTHALSLYTHPDSLQSLVFQLLNEYAKLVE